MEEDAVLQVFSVEEDWLLVRVEGSAEHLGFVPRTYCEPLDESQEVEVADAAEAEADLEEQRQQDAIDLRAREAAERQRQLKLKDKVETWGVSQVEGKKKKKGTLGVGNGAVFFASDTDKVSSTLLVPSVEADISVTCSTNLYLRARLGIFSLIKRDPTLILHSPRSSPLPLRWIRYR